MQQIIRNTKYQIKTHYGWDDFEGIAHNGKKVGRQLFFNDNTDVLATYDHKFSKNGIMVDCSTLKVGDKLDTDTIDIFLTVTDIKENIEVDAFDILGVDNIENTFIANKLKTQNCDELAFVQRRIALEFWTSVFPTLSCLVGSTYILNPVDGYRRLDSYLDEITKDYKKGDYYKVHDEYTWGMNGIESISHLYISPDTDTLKVRTLTGYEVEVTLKHPMFVTNIDDELDNGSMIPAKLLEVGVHRIRYDIGMKCFGNNKLPIDYRQYDIIDIEDVLSTDYCMTLDAENTFKLLSGIFTTSDSIQLDIEKLYRLKLILANYGFLSVIDYDISTLYISAYKDSPYYGYDIITNIEKSSADITYDFTIPNTHSFLQNGLMGSNTGGSCIITSTPTDDETLFADIWKQAEQTYDEHGIENPDGVGINGFKALRIKWDAHPERDESFKQMSIRQFGEEKFQREHELEFVSEEETLLAPLYLKNMGHIDPLYTTGNNVRWFKEPSKEFMYFIALDPSMGTGGDYSAIQVFEFPSLEQVGEWMHNRSDPSVQIRMVIGILNGFKDAGFKEENIWWTFENNGCGDTINMYLREVEDEHEIFGTLVKEPWIKGKKRPRKGLLTTNMNKRNAYARMKMWIEKDLMKIHSRPLIKQFKTFIRSGATYRAILGEYDDLVLGVMLITRMIEKAMGEEEEFMESLGVARDILVDDDDDGDYFPLPVA